MLSIARRREVHIEFGARGSVRLDSQTDVVLSQRLKTIVDFLRDQAALFNPALDALVGAYSDEAFLPLQHVHPFAVVDGTNLAVHGGDAVAQASLQRGDVHVFVLGDSRALAGGRRRQHQECGKRYQCPEQTRVGRSRRYHISL